MMTDFERFVNCVRILYETNMQDSDNEKLYKLLFGFEYRYKFCFLRKKRIKLVTESKKIIKNNISLNINSYREKILFRDQCEFRFWLLGEYILVIFLPDEKHRCKIEICWVIPLSLLNSTVSRMEYVLLKDHPRIILNDVCCDNILFETYLKKIKNNICLNPVFFRLMKNYLGMLEEDDLNQLHNLYSATQEILEKIMKKGCLVKL